MGPGKLWDDLGSTTFVTIKNDAEGTMPSTRNAKRRELERKMNESSDDELDFLSSSSRSDDVEQPIPTKRKPRLKKKQPEKAVIQGREADYHPDGPKKKLPDFKKIVNTVQEGSSSTSRSKTSSTTQKALMQTRSYGMLATLHDNENGRLSWPSDGLSSDEDSSVDRTHSSIQVSSQREIQKFPGLRLSPLRVSSQDSPHKPRDCTKGPNSFEQPKPLHGKTSPSSSGTNNRSTLTSCRASRIQYSDSSSETTPRAKHPENRLRKFPILNPLSISDHLALEMVGGSGPSPTHRSTLSDTTTPRKNCKSRYPFPSPLSSPAHQTSQNSATALRGTDRRGTLDVMTDEDADDECQERRLQPRPFPMVASQSNATHRTPRRNNACTERAWPDNGRNSTFLSDAEVFGDDPRQRHPSMLATQMLTIYQFLLGNQRIHRAYVLFVMRNFHLTPRHSISPFSKRLDVGRIRILVQVTLVDSKLRWVYTLHHANVIDLKRTRYPRLSLKVGRRTSISVKSGSGLRD